MTVSPATFCVAMGALLSHEVADTAWVRGATGVCQMYARTDAQRFDTILRQMARGSAGSALADGARWLLPRWQAYTP